MKIIAISDTHNKHETLTLPEGDILVHAGDATSKGSEYEVRRFLDWMRKQDFIHKIFVAGNHDWFCETNPGLTKMMCQERGIHYLENSGLIIKSMTDPSINIRFWGSPVQPRFNDWAFNKDRGEEIKRYWDMIPAGIDILITHGPPYGILDLVHDCEGKKEQMIHVGCQDLLKRVKALKPRVHIFGHIHSNNGEFHEDGTSFYNVAILPPGIIKI